MLTSLLTSDPLNPASESYGSETAQPPFPMVGYDRKGTLISNGTYEKKKRPLWPLTVPLSPGSLGQIGDILLLVGRVF